MRPLKYRTFDDDVGMVTPSIEFSGSTTTWAIHGYGKVTNPKQMEFIGLEDKNDVDIYEDDILLTEEAGWKGRVVYQRARFILIDNHGGFSVEPNWGKCEVIGNIWDDPGLLE